MAGKKEEHEKRLKLPTSFFINFQIPEKLINFKEQK